MQKILIIDNYDSFTYNLVHLVEKVTNAYVTVKRNDQVSAQDCYEFDKIILSPGPGIPSEAGNMPQIIKEIHDKKTILGVCLGHQALGEFFGGTLQNLSRVFHGVATPVTVKDNCKLFQDIPATFLAGRYHSWVIKKDSVGAALVVTCVDETGEIMAFRHRTLPIYGVQFHPESILSEYGEQLMLNFLNL